MRSLKMKTSFIKELEKEFGKEIGLHSCMLFEKDFRQFIDKIKPKIFVDIGTFKGLSAGFVAKYYADIVYTFDIDRGEGLIGHGLSRECGQKELGIKYKVWDYLEVRDKIREFTLNPNTQYQEKKVILDNIQFDMALLDGDHQYKYVKQDFSLVKKCGAVIFDDFYWANGDDVRRFLCELSGHGEAIKVGERFALWRGNNGR